MKLDSRVKNFYLKSIGVPLIGSLIIGPSLRSIWKISVWVHSKLNCKSDEDVTAVVSSYSAIIYSLQQRVELLERKIVDIQSESESRYHRSEYMRALDCSALNGIYMAISNEKRKL